MQRRGKDYVKLPQRAFNNWGNLKIAPIELATVRPHDSPRDSVLLTHP